MLTRLLKIYLRPDKCFIILQSSRTAFGFSSADITPMGSRLCKGREAEGSQECVCAENNNPERVTRGRVRLYKRACLRCGGREEGREMRVAKLPPRGAFPQCI